MCRKNEPGLWVPYGRLPKPYCTSRSCSQLCSGDEFGPSTVEIAYSHVKCAEKSCELSKHANYQSLFYVIFLLRAQSWVLSKVYKLARVKLSRLYCRGDEMDLLPWIREKLVVSVFWTFKLIAVGGPWWQELCWLKINTHIWMEFHYQWNLIIVLLSNRNIYIRQTIFYIVAVWEINWFSFLCYFSHLWVENGVMRMKVE